MLKSYFNYFITYIRLSHFKKEDKSYPPLNKEKFLETQFNHVIMGRLEDIK